MFCNGFGYHLTVSDMMFDLQFITESRIYNSQLIKKSDCITIYMNALALSNLNFIQIFKEQQNPVTHYKQLIGLAMMRADLSQQKQFKLTTQQKLAILDAIIAQFQPVYPLSVQRTDQPIARSIKYQKNQSEGLASYSVLGIRSTRKTQNANLCDKIDELKRRINGQQQNNPVQEEGKNYRYFRQNMRCFRCRRKGHYKSVCPQQFSCIYCLSFNHNYQKCPQKIVCYRCYGYGHVVNECSQSSEGPYCNSCKRKHFDPCYFLTKGIEQVKQLFNTDILYNNQQIRCMVCLKYGHITCG